MADSQRKTANIYNKTNVITMTIGDRYGVYVPIDTYSIYNDTDNIVYWFAENGKSIFEACQPHSTSTVTLFGNTTGFYMPYNSASLGDITIVQGSTAPNHYIPYGWQHSLRKFTTATEAVKNPLYSDGTAITSYTIKGNTVQNGTPTSTNPVEVNGVGERTENLFNTFDIVGQVPSTGNGVLVNYDGSTTSFIPISSGNVVVTKPENVLIYLMLYAANGDYIGYDIAKVSTTINGSNISGYENARFARLRIDITTPDVQIMFNEGATAKPYEPYGYKIPISNGQQTTNIYLGSTQTVRQIKKLVLTGEESGWYLSGTNSYGIANYGLPSALTSFIANNPISTHFVYQSTLQSDTKTEGIFTNNYLNLYVRVYAADLPNKTAFVNWLRSEYANGTPVTIWYIATPETAIVNEPLMKIGDYADTLSNAAQIPTTEGANSITVDTTVQPSEFTATWTGWHNATVKEKSENLFDGEWVQGSININGNLVSSSERIRAFQTVQPNTTYTFSSTKYVRLIYGYNGDEKVGVIYDVDANLSQSITFTTQSECNRIGIAIAASTTATGNITPSDISEVMLNTGSTALPYEPYWK